MHDTDRQQGIHEKIDRVARGFSGQVAFAAKNLATGEEILFNADAVFPTASVIKLAVLVEAFRKAGEGALRMDERLEMGASDIVAGSGVLKELMPGLQPTIFDLATLMVVVSDNTATNMLIDRVGGVDAINRTMQEQYGLASVVLHNRVDFDRIGDDIRGFAEATAGDLMRLVELLVRGAVVSPEASRAMLDIMNRQQYLDQVPRYFAYNPYAKELGEPQSFRVASKTGFTSGVRADAGAVFLPGDVTLAYCAMTQHSADSSFSAENEGAVANGLLGRLMLEHWWPEGEAPLLDSPYVRQSLS